MMSARRGIIQSAGRADLSALMASLFGIGQYPGRDTHGDCIRRHTPVDQCAGSDNGILSYRHILTRNDRSFHSYICAVLYHYRIVLLLASVTCEIHSVGNSDIIANPDFVVTHVVKIASHTDESILSDAVTASPIAPHAEIIEWNCGNYYGREELADRLCNDSEYRIFPAIRYYPPPFYSTPMGNSVYSLQ